MYFAIQDSMRVGIYALVHDTQGLHVRVQVAAGTFRVTGNDEFNTASNPFELHMQ